MFPTRILPLLAALFLGSCADRAPGNDPLVIGEVRRVEQNSGSSARFQAISVVDSLTVWISGSLGTVGVTADGGRTWRTFQGPGADSLEFRDLHAVSDRVVYLLSAGPGDRSRIYKTVDGGVSWSLQFINRDPDAFFDCFDFWDADHGLAMSDAVQGRFPILRTDDGGASWIPIDADRLPPPLPGEGGFAASGTCVVTVGDSSAFIATGASGLGARVLMTDDRGETWAVAETPVVHDTTLAGLTSTAWIDRQRGIAVGGNLAVTDRPLEAVARTEDGGRTWTLGGGVPFAGTIFGAMAVPESGGLLVAVGPRGAAYTQDLGLTWTAIDSLNYWSAGFAGARAGWAVGPGGRVTRLEFVEPGS